MNFIKGIFSPPQFRGDEFKTHQAFLLNVILWALIALPVPYVLLTSLSAPLQLPRAIAQTTFGELVNFFLLWLMHRGHVQAAARLQIAMFWIFFTANALTGAGLQGLNYLLGYSLVIVITGVLLGGKGAFLITGLSILSGLVMLYGTQAGWLRSNFADDPLNVWGISSIVFPIVTLLQYLAERTLRQALKRTQLEIAERKVTAHKLQDSLQEKEVLLKEIHHRVKNNMQVIVSLMNLQIAQISDSNSIRVLRESQNRVRSMALVHEKLYQTESLAKIDFGDYLHQLASTLLYSYSSEINGIDLQVDVIALSLEIDQAIPCGLIANELVSNAFKHAFPAESAQPKIVRVQLCATPTGEVRLIVEDNGVGIPAEKVGPQLDSLGVQLVQSLAKQLHGAIELERLNPGTKFVLSFPKP